MLDEFDDPPESAPVAPGKTAVGADRQRRATRVARLVCRLYAAASPTLRAKLLSCLLRPLGTLGRAGIAAGAFGAFLYRGGSDSARTAVGDVARFSNDQMFELARFVEQVSPDALQEFARLFSERQMGVAAFTASAALLLIQALSPMDRGSAEQTAASASREPAKRSERFES
jgi:hypothetical protein